MGRRALIIGDVKRGAWAHVGGSLAVLIAATACAGTREDDSAASPSSSPSGHQSAHEICLAGVHNTPLSEIQIERAVAAPLSAVKAWVLSGEPTIDWTTFSSDLADAPLNEEVAVCLFSKRDGARFTLPPGVNTPEPTEAIVQIVRPNGQGGALYLAGSVNDMLEVTPTSRRELRQMAS